MRNSLSETLSPIAPQENQSLRHHPVQVVSPAPRDVWAEIQHADVEALPYQNFTWLDCVCAIDRYEDISRYYQLPNGKQIILPLVRRKGLPFAASMPTGWGIGGLISSAPLEPNDIELIFRDLTELPLWRICIRPNPRNGEVWAKAHLPGAVTVPRLAHVIDLSQGFDQVWSQQFKSATRRAVRKAEKANLVVECDTTGKLVPVFYHLLELSFARWAGQQHEPLALARWRGRRRDPIRKFELMTNRLGQGCKIWVAWHQGQPAATILTLQDDNGNVNYSRGAMDEAIASPVQANTLLQKLAIEDACRAGYRFYNMGETGSSAGLAQYKRRFGAEGYPYAEYRYERFPLTQLDKSLRDAVKRIIGFKDA